MRLEIFYLYALKALLVQAEDFGFVVSANVINTNSSATYCEKGSLPYIELSNKLTDQVKAAIQTVHSIENVQFEVILCPSKHGFKLSKDQKAANVIFPVLAAGAFFISVLFVRWKNMEREELLLRRQRGVNRLQFSIVDDTEKSATI